MTTMQLPVAQFSIEQIIAAFCMTKTCYHYVHMSKTYFTYLSDLYTNSQVVNHESHLSCTYIKLLVRNLFAKLFSVKACLCRKKFPFPAALFRSFVTKGLLCVCFKLFVTSKIEFSNPPIFQFSNLKCCIKAKEPYKNPF